MQTHHGSSVSVAATASNVQGVITMPVGANGLHIANTSATLYVTVAVGTSAQTAVLGASLTLPPMGHIVLDVNKLVSNVAAIGSAAGPTAVVFTPVNT